MEEGLVELRLVKKNSRERVPVRSKDVLKE